MPATVRITTARVQPTGRRAAGIAAVLVTGAASAQTTWWVDASCGDDTWSGRSPVCQAPDGPRASIQAAITFADDGDEIIVRPGVYPELVDLNGRAVHLHSEAGPEVTTIDGDGLGGSVLTCITGEGPDTVIEGFTVTGGIGTVISGNGFAGGGLLNLFSPTVRNCFFENNMAEIGAGVFTNAGLRLEGCRFTTNTAFVDGGGLRLGVDLLSNPMVVLQDCVFEGNTAFGAGGAVDVLGGEVVLHDCTFIGNGATDGGAIFLNDRMTATGCLFSTNFANIGGAIALTQNVGALLDSCRLEGNCASKFGGGIDVFEGVVTLVETTFQGNLARDGAGMSLFRGMVDARQCAWEDNAATRFGGGAIVQQGSVVTFDGSAFRRNAATEGGGLDINGDARLVPVEDTTVRLIRTVLEENNASARGGGVKIVAAADGVAINTVFRSNSAPEGGAVHVKRVGSPAAMRLAGCLLSSNEAGQRGSALHLADGAGSVELTNCSVAGNIGGTDPRSGPLSVSPGSSATVANSIVWLNDPATIDARGSVTVRHSTVEGGFPGPGNSRADPRFADPLGPDGTPASGDEDFRPGPGSHAIDSGSNPDVVPDEADLDQDMDVAEPLPFDLDGSARFVDAPNYADIGVGGAGRPLVDRGAYEAGATTPGPTLVCEFDGDRLLVEMDDLDRYVRLWFERDLATELTGDVPPSIDIFDLLAFLDCWFVASGTTPPDPNWRPDGTDEAHAKAVISSLLPSSGQ